MVYLVIQNPMMNTLKVLQNWFTTRFNWTPDRKWLVKTPGIVFALAMAVRAFTNEGEGVLINQPVYYPFSMVIDDNDRRLINVPLIKGKTNIPSILKVSSVLSWRKM